MRRLKRKIIMGQFMASCVVMLTFYCISPERVGKSLSHEQQTESKSRYQETLDKTGDSGIRFAGGDGSSMEKAIIISGAKNELEASPAEIDYISRRHGERDKSWKMMMQSDFKENNRAYVEYQIEDFKKGITTVYFFDNTAFYSVFLEDTGAPMTPTQAQKDTKLTYQTAMEKTDSSGVRYAGGDGSSMENAIIIIGPEKEKAVSKAAIDYISKKLGERDKTWKLIRQGDFRKDQIQYKEYQIEDYKRGIKTACFFENTSLRSAFPKDTGALMTPTQVQKDTQLTYQTAMEKTDNSGVRYAGGDGSSMENAIIIIGPENEKEASKAENDYISGKHGEKDRSWKILLQGDYRKNLRQYREISIKETNSGDRFDYWFDVSGVSGK